MVTANATLTAALEHGVDGDQLVILENADLVGQGMHLDHAPTRAVRDRVEIAADRHHTLARDAAVQGKDNIKRHGGQCLEVWLLVGEVLQDDTAGGSVPARVGDCVEPVAELGIQIVEVAEGATEKEVFAHIAERALYLALRLCPVGRAGLRQKPIMRRQIEELAIVGDALIIDLTQYRRLHAVVEDLRRYPAQLLEGGNVAAQDGLQVLLNDKAAPHHPTMAEHQ